MKNKHSFLIIAILFFGVFMSTSFTSFAQGNDYDPEEFAINVAHAQFKAKQVIPPAPEAASLGKYGNVPVSLYTGTPNIAVPLYNVPSSRISLPLTMNYSAQGFKPQEIAPWVGYGWSLNAGGVITRSVIGNPDIYDNYYSKPALTNPPSTEDMFVYYDIVKDMRDGRREDQPDVYYYNFGNYSGKFFIMRDGTVIKKTKDNLIIANSDGSGFTITDDQGNIYMFNAAETTTTISGDLVAIPEDVQPAHSSYTYVSSVYLSSIYSADGNETISFEYYETGNHKQFGNSFQNQTVTYSNRMVITGGDCITGGSLPQQISSSSSPITFTSRKYLKKISFSRNGTVAAYIDFISAADQRLDLDNSNFPGERRLDGIKIYNLQSNGSLFQLEKEFVFNYGYFTRQTTYALVNEKLKLESILEKPSDVNTAQKPAYQFTYNPLINSSENYETAIDHWGFYNGANNSSLIPNYQVSPGVYYGLGAAREPSFGATAAALLTKITYPTGGYTEFIYEGNEAKDENNDFMYAGGIRIKEITDYSFDTKKAITKKYSYTLDDGSTSGKCQRPYYLGNSSNYHKYGEMCRGNAIVCCGASSETETSSITMGANAVYGLGSIQGSHIVYTKVTEKQTEVTNGQELGKTVYEYAHNGFVLNDDDIYNGSLLRQAVYNNGSKLLSETVNEYTGSLVSVGSIVNWTFEASANQDNKMILCKYLSGTYFYRWQRVSENANISPACVATRVYKTKFSITGYLVIPQSKLLSKQTQKVYDQVSDSYITNVNEFVYGNNAHTLPTKIIQTTSNNETVVTEKKYPLDYTGTGNDLPAAGIIHLKNSNIVGAEIETIQYRDNVGGGNKRYVSGSLSIYNAPGIFPVQLYGLNLTQPLTSFTMSSITGGGLFSYHSNYRLLGNLNYTSGNLVSQSKANDIVTSYIWDYTSSQPTAEVVNADPNMIAYTSFETDQTGMWTSIPALTANRVTNGITGKFSYQLTSGNTITSSSIPTSRIYLVCYWSKNGAINVSSNTGSSTSVTGRSSNGWTYYEHTLPANSSSVSITASSANIDELRLYPKDAQMTTMAYGSYNGTQISQGTANNSIASFEYDGYQRLVNVKDDEGNIVKNYKYNYGLGTAPNASTQTFFYNIAAQSEAIYKVGCPTGSEPTAVYYKIPYGKHVSVNSLAEANQKAQDDIAANKQNYANQYGTCLYWNDYREGIYVKNNCQYWEGPADPGGTAYIVPAHTISSTISKAIANQQAEALILANGQSNANMFGSCTCTMIGYRFVNGQCEQGQVSYVGYVYEPGCSPGMNYRCYYYYYFSDGYQTQVMEMCSYLPCHQY